MNKINLTVDSLFPADNGNGQSGRISGNTNKRLDIETLFTNTPLDKTTNINFNTNIMINRREKMRKKKLEIFRHMLRYCYDRIEAADADHITDIVFTVMDNVPDCKSFDPVECMEYIQEKIRCHDFDTLILNNNSMFITWKYIELKKMKKLTDPSNTQSDRPIPNRTVQHPIGPSNTQSVRSL